jgi:2-aminoadipate transaminase
VYEGGAVFEGGTVSRCGLRPPRPRPSERSEQHDDRPQNADRPGEPPWSTHWPTVTEEWCHYHSTRVRNDSECVQGGGRTGPGLGYDPGALMSVDPTSDSTSGWAGSFARRTREARGEITAILALAGASEVITFSGGFPAPETCPSEQLAGVAADLIRHDGARALQYAPTPGLPGLREVLTDHLALSQGVRAAENELLVTSGGIDALALVGRAMLDAGDVVAVEAPTYLGAISAFRGFEATLAEVAMDRDGLDIDAFGRLLASGRTPKLLYTIPDHHNPTGLTMSAERRQPLVDLCRRHGVLIVEDVAYRELGPPAAPSLWSLGPDIVVQIGTFSKTMFPGVRLGWATGPAPVLAELVTAKQNSDQCAGALGQCLAETYLRTGDYTAQLPRSRALYDERRQAMLAALAKHLPAGVTWTTPTGGFFTWLSLPVGVDTVRMSRAALVAGIAYVPGTAFYAGAGRGAAQLRLAYSRVTVDDITEGVRRLGGLLATVY